MKCVEQIEFRPGEDPTAICFHPSRDVLTVGKRGGQITAYDVRSDGIGQPFELPNKSGNFCCVATLWDEVDMLNGGLCRSVCMTGDGSGVIAASAAGTIGVIDMQTGRTKGSIESEYDDEDEGEEAEDAVYCVEAIDNNVFASGHGDGEVKLWDIRAFERTQSEKHSMKDQEDYISSMYHIAAKCSLVATSGDGTLAVYDTRKLGKVKGMSDSDGDELLCVTAVKGGKKLVTGSQEGVLGLWSWGHFEGCSDRYPGHPDSVDALLRFDEDTVLTGSSDSGLRLVSILPNKLIGFLGVHHEDTYGLSRMAMQADRRVLASISLELGSETVTMWDLSTLHDDSEEDDEDEEEEEDEAEGDDPDEDDAPGNDGKDEPAAKRQRGSKPGGEKTSMKGKGQQPAGNFFQGLL